MTANEMNALIGAHVYLEPHRGLRIRCRITNVKTAYGRQRVEIEAIDGEGRAWVNAETVQPCYPAPAVPNREVRANGHR